MQTFKKNLGLMLGVGILSLGLLAFGSSQANGEAVADFYKGKTIHWIVSSSPGSNTDLLTRLTAQYLGKKIGAKVKVENMGRNKGLNYVFTKAKPDGLTLVTKARTALVLNDVAKAPGLRYKAAEFIYMVDLLVDGSAMFVKPGSKITNQKIMAQTKGLKAGGTSARGFFATVGSVMFELMGVDGKVIPGYKGPPKLIMAVVQGEVDCMAWNALASKKKVEDGTVKPIFIIGKKRFSIFPDVPTFEEQGGRVPDSMATAYGLVSTGGQAVAGPPGIPTDRVAFLRNTFKELGQSKELQGEIKKLIGVFQPFESGESVQANIEGIMANTSLSKQLKSIVEKYTAAR